MKFGSSVARRETEQAWMVGWDVPHGILVTGGGMKRLEEDEKDEDEKDEGVG